MEMETDPGSSSEHPDIETTLLEEEEIICGPEERLCRVLTLFECRRGNLITPIPIGASSPEEYKDLEIVGVVGTIHNKQGLFAQCGWFGNYDLDWFWCRIINIWRIEIKSDIRFRGGDPCAWLSTPRGDYAMLLPRATYVDTWEESLYNSGKNGPSAKVQIWPPYGTRPTWWSDRWKDCWPWDKEPETEPASTNQGWVRLGPSGDYRFPGEPLSHLHHFDPWVIVPNSGRRPTPDGNPGNAGM